MINELDSLKEFVQSKLSIEDYGQFEELLEAYIATEYTVGYNINSVKFYNPFLSTEEAQSVLDRIEFEGIYEYIELAKLVQNIIPKAQIEYIKSILIELYGKDIYKEYFLDSNIAELFLEDSDYNDPTIWATLEMTLEEYNPSDRLQEFVYKYIQDTCSKIEQEKFYLMLNERIKQLSLEHPFPTTFI